MEAEMTAVLPKGVVAMWGPRSSSSGEQCAREKLKTSPSSSGVTVFSYFLYSFFVSSFLLLC